MDGAGRIRDQVALAGGAVLLAALACGAKAHAAPRGIVVFELRQDRVIAPPGAPSRALPVGSLSKPFVAHAWASAHPGASPPVVNCEPASHCWTSSGHGTVGLARAIAVSCNTYFRALAADTPATILISTLRADGLLPPDPLTPDGAIGLSTDSGIIAAQPAAVLRAYSALVREPWEPGEPVRRDLLAGLRHSAHEGTAAALLRLAVYAKTGTVPALDGRTLATSGWALALDEGGRGFLALLTPGTGREAALTLAQRLRGATPGPSSTMARPASSILDTATDPPPVVTTPFDARGPDRVLVLLFGALAPHRVIARNVGRAPVATTRGFVGAGSRLELRAGDRLAEGEWELHLPSSGLRRVVRGAAGVSGGPGDALRVRADLTSIEYVAGIIRGELAAGDSERRVSLGAAVLRFLREGPRHGDADCCDLTHCAYFVGRGPRYAWPSPTRAALFETPLAGAAAEEISQTEWRRMVAASREQGPARWTSHCGGAPLSSHFLWGGDDRRVFACDRHGPADRAEWTRHWSRRDVDRAFGGSVNELRVADDGGQWRLAVRRAENVRLLTWDEAHARLAAVLGWGALPSPADRVTREGTGYRADGRGLGHRVGLCLGWSPDSGLLN